MTRREYGINITVNERIIMKVIIDNHYEKKHKESINDEIILSLVKKLNHTIVEPDDIKEGYEYFVADKKLNGKIYRLIWLLENNKFYIGVVNAYRRS